jgi:S-(hydroxymethyl)glutathione dehydrogenase/alcohol dehydrogenase
MCTIVGIGGKDDMVSFSALELFHFARTLRGCVAGSLDAANDLPSFFNLVRTGKLELGQLVTGHGGLTDIDDALNQLAAGRGIRTLLGPGCSSCSPQRGAECRSAVVIGRLDAWPPST